MRVVFLALPLVLLCQRSTPEPLPVQPVGRLAQRPVPRLIELSGRYEAGPSRLCIVPGRLSGRFALVIRPTASESCSGSGSVVREGDAIRFTMRGDSPCSFRASIVGRTLVFPASVPAGCAYYCGARTTLAGARIRQRGTGRAQAVKARDLVGESLCIEE